MRSRSAIVLCGATLTHTLAALLTPAAAHASVPFEIVGRAGYTVGNMPGWHTLTPEINTSSITDAHGNILFRGRVRNSSTTEEAEAILWGGDGVVQSVVRIGQVAPGLPEGTVFSSFVTATSEPVSRIYRTSTNRTMTFIAKVQGPAYGAAGAVGHWRVKDGKLRLLALNRGNTPGAEFDARFEQFATYAPDIAGSASSVFLAKASVEIDGVRSSRVGIWHGRPHALRPLAIAGGQVPGLASGVTYYSFSDLNPTYVDPLWSARTDLAGGVVYDARIAGVGVDDSNDSALFWSRPGYEPVIVLREGDSVPGLPPERTFGDLGSFSLPRRSYATGKEHVAVVKTIDVDGSSHSGVWVHRDGVTSKVFFRGDDAPDPDPAKTIRAVTDEPFANNRGQTVVHAEVGVVFSDYSSIILLDSDLTFREIARDNVPWPDVGVGLNIRDLDILDFNDKGQCLLRARVGADLVDGVLAYDPVLGLTPLMLEGQLIDGVRPFPTTVRDINVQTFSLSERGDITFAARVDGPGTIVLSFHIPAPASATLLFACAPLVGRSRRTRK